MRYPRIVLAGIVLAAATCMAEEIWGSPNGRLECASGLGRQRKGQELWVRASAVPASRALVWASEGWMEVVWSPDSRFLAVMDHFASEQSAVLVFTVSFNSEKKSISTALLFETPLKEKRKQEWEVKDWNLKRGQVLLLKKEGKSRSLFTALLSERPIEQTLYSRDPRGTAPVHREP